MGRNRLMIFDPPTEPRNGLDFCACGAKYWQGFRCASCDDLWPDLADKMLTTNLAVRLDRGETGTCVLCRQKIHPETCWSMLVTNDGLQAVTMDAPKSWLTKVGARWVNACMPCVTTLVAANFRIVTRERPQTWVGNQP